MAFNEDARVKIPALLYLRLLEYGCIDQSLFDILYQKSDEDLLLSGYGLEKFNKNASLIKKRAPSCGNNGKSGGFRLLIFVNIRKQESGLIMVYPKWGSMMTECPSKKIWKNRLKDYSDCKDKGKLKEIKFNTQKKVIVLKE